MFENLFHTDIFGIGLCSFTLPACFLSTVLSFIHYYMQASKKEVIFYLLILQCVVVERIKNAL